MKRLAMRRLRALWLCVALLPGGSLADTAQPEAASGQIAQVEVRAPRSMVVTANPHATLAAQQMLAEGGSAADAAVAAALVLNVVEPQSSGLGGGGFWLHYDARNARLEAWDGRESAPQRLDSRGFLDGQGRPLPFATLVASGQAVGTPALGHLLEAVHRAHGRLPWARLFEPAIRLADEGFAVSPRLARLIARDPHLPQQPAARALFFSAEGRPLQAGETLRNPALARSLRVLAGQGAAAFYRGEFGRRVVAAVAAQPLPGQLALDDLAGYRVIGREPLCAPYRQWRICGMPPPSSGPATVLAILGLLERFALPELDAGSAFVEHLFLEASRLAYADRDAWQGDPRAMPLPAAALLDRHYLAERSATIGFAASTAPALPGEPRGARPRAVTEAAELPATTHLSIVDAEGNAVSLTASIEAAFGSRILVDGILLNNQLTDFSLDAAPDHPNAPAPGRRPRSSMSPMMVFDTGGRLELVIGSPGGSQIIAYVARALSGLLDHGLSSLAAVSRPHVAQRNRGAEVEDSPEGRALAERLGLFGHAPVLREMTSGLALIRRSPDGWVGVADPRREGRALGD